MSLSDAKQKFSELQSDLVYYFSQDHEEDVKGMVDLLKKYPALYSDVLNMMEEYSDDIDDSYKKDLLDTIMEINPELGLNIIKRFDDFHIDDFLYPKSKIEDILRKNPNSVKQIIKSVGSWKRDTNLRDAALGIIIKRYPKFFSQAIKLADDKNYVAISYIEGRKALSEKDVDMIMGEFSYKKFKELYSENMEKGLEFIEKLSKGNPDNIEIQKKCLLFTQNYDANKNTKRISNEILVLQPKLKEFAEQLALLNLEIPTFPKLKKLNDKKLNTFAYTTGNSNLTQLQHRMNLNGLENEHIIATYLQQNREEQKDIYSEINKIENTLKENTDLNKAIRLFNSLATKVNSGNFGSSIMQELQNQRTKISSQIIKTHQYYGKQIQQILNSPEKLGTLLEQIDFSDDTSSFLVFNIIKIANHSKNVDILRILAHKKEEAYGVWNYRYIREIEDSFADKKYIEKILNKKYPDLSLEEQLIQAAYDVVKSGDEQKKKEFNDFILAEGEPRLSELDAKVMDYLHENCTQSNLDKVNALRSFYGLKVELATGKEVDADERAAVRKVFDRTWSSYERGKNTETGEPYYSEREIEVAKKEDPDNVQVNPYYENAVSPAYRKYFEENDIYEIYNDYKSEEDKKYSMQDYFTSLIDKSSFKALRKHGLYNDMKVICKTLEKLQVEPEIASQFNLKDLSDMVVNSHNTFSDRKVYNHETYEYMFTKSPHTDELNGVWRDPYYWHQYDDDDEYDDEYDNDDYEDANENDDNENLSKEKQYDAEGFEIITDKDYYYSEANEEVAARDAWWEDLSNHNPKAVKLISEAFTRHDREDDATSGFWEAASFGTPGVGSRRDWRLLSATLHHAQAIQYGGNDDTNNFVGATRYYDSYGDTFDEDELHIDYHKSFHRRDTPMDALYINPEKSASYKLAITEKPDENAQKAFLITSFTDPHMHFYAGFRKKDQYTDPLYHMRNIEKEKQERVNKTEKALEYLTTLGNALSSISICFEHALKTEEKIKNSKEKVVKNIMPASSVSSSLNIHRAQNYSSKSSVKDIKNTR